MFILMFCINGNNFELRKKFPQRAVLLFPFLKGSIFKVCKILTEAMSSFGFVSIFLCLYICICTYVSVFVSLCMCICIYEFVNLYLYLCLRICIYVFVFVYSYKAMSLNAQLCVAWVLAEAVVGKTQVDGSANKLGKHIV